MSTRRKLLSKNIKSYLFTIYKPNDGIRREKYNETLRIRYNNNSWKDVKTNMIMHTKDTLYVIYTVYMSLDYNIRYRRFRKYRW